MVEIVPARFHPDEAKQRVDLQGPAGMAFFPGPAGVVGHLEIRLVVERFEQMKNDNYNSPVMTIKNHH
jgi:hypothetical protein